ncbi:MAG: hypothetical protein DSY37_00940 [Hyperthermus sp.]|nr:MAG: hypothetical protein DSY37_00940 [Hyperthermus sp.]
MPRSLAPWRTTPLYYAIVEELERRGGSAKDIEVYRALREKYLTLSFSDFLHELMKLEMQGVIYVSVIKEDLRNIELLART